MRVLAQIISHPWIFHHRWSTPGSGFCLKIARQQGFLVNFLRTEMFLEVAIQAKGTSNCLQAPSKVLQRADMWLEQTEYRVYGELGNQRNTTWFQFSAYFDHGSQWYHRHVWISHPDSQAVRVLDMKHAYTFTHFAVPLGALELDKFG